METLTALGLTVLLAAGAAGATLHFEGAPELVQADIVSTPRTEIRIAFSPDGRRRLWGTIGWEGGAGGWDIWESERTGDTWSAPRPVSFNSPANDFDPFVTADGVYFFSNRPGGQGGDDLWFAARDAKGFYGGARNLGPAVNTAADEWAPTLSADGRRLLFASDGHGSRGHHDLFVSARKGSGWGPPKPLPGAVNSDVDDFDACWLRDGRTLVFSRKPNEADEAALFVSVEKNGVYGEPVRLGPEVNVEAGWNLGPAIDPAQPGWLYFTSQRSEAGRGRADIYRIRYELR